MASALPSYPPFVCNAEGRAVRWAKGLSRLKNLFTVYNSGNYQRQKALLLSFAGDELTDVVDTSTEDQLTSWTKSDPFWQTVYLHLQLFQSSDKC